MTKAAPSLLITPEKLDSIMRADLSSYRTPAGRAALRGALGSAAGLCDFMATELAAQNKGRGGHVNKATASMAEAFKRCGDEIWRMRERVKVTEGTNTP